MSGHLDDNFVIPLLLRQYSDFFSIEEREDFDDEEMQYELFWGLLTEEGEYYCENEWDSGIVAGKSWIKKIGNYFYAYDEIELYGPFESLDDALENASSCRYISDATVDIYIDKPILDNIDWIIVAKDDHTLTINGENYKVKKESLVKL